MGVTSIAWTATILDGTGDIIPGYTWNGWIGCTKVSEGCQSCYAEAEQDLRYHRVRWGPSGSRSMTSEAYWHQPIRWDREAAASGVRRRVFCASLADVFEDWRGHILDAKGNVLWYDPERGIIRAGETTPGLVRGERTATMDDLRSKLWWLIHLTPNLDWLLLTKRPERMARWVEDHLVPPNVWLGVSVEDQQRADERIPALLEIPAAVRFLSVEPLLGLIDLGCYLGSRTYRCRCGFHVTENELIFSGGDRYSCPDCHGPCEILPGIDWAIVGGESGPHARPCDLAWIRWIRDQCKAAGVPVFVKQDTGPRPGMQGRIPDDLWKIKEFPRISS